MESTSRCETDEYFPFRSLSSARFCLWAFSSLLSARKRAEHTQKGRFPPPRVRFHLHSRQKPGADSDLERGRCLTEERILSVQQIVLRSEERYEEK